MAHNGSVLEHELKVAVPREFVVPDFTGFEELACRSAELRATYWDTAALTLAGWGHTLRHRRAADGSEDSWTLKLSGEGSRFAVRREISFEGDQSTPPVAALDLVQGIVGHAVLAPVAVITTLRSTRQLRHLASEAVIEVADDEVFSQVAGDEGPAFREIEVEILTGDKAVLQRASKLLRRAGAGSPDPTPKLVRVLAPRPGSSFEAAGTPPVTTVADLVRVAIGGTTHQLLAHDPAIRLAGDVEDIHKARVATRRLRSDLKTLSPLCDEFRIEGLRRELAWLGSVLGHVRDADVLAVTLASRAAQSEGLDAAAVDGLQRRLGDERHDALATLLDVMRSSRYHGLVTDLRRLAQEPPLRPDQDGDAPAKPVARKVTAKAFDRVKRRIDGLPAPPPLTDLHDVRKAVKRARYAAELMSAVSDGQTDDLAVRLADLQDQLGAGQDEVTARRWLCDRAGDPTIDMAQAFAAGRLAQAFTEQPSETPSGWRRTWDKASRPKHRSWLR